MHSEAAEVLSVQVVPDLAAFNRAPLACIDFLAAGSPDAHNGQRPTFRALLGRP